MGYLDVMELPYEIFLALLRQAYIKQLRQSPEGQAQLEQAQVKPKGRTQPDFSKIRGMDGYQKQII